MYASCWLLTKIQNLDSPASRAFLRDNQPQNGSMDLEELKI